MSFKDLPLLYETIGGSWNISLRSCCCWIKCHFCMSSCLRLGTAGGYCVTKDKIRLSSLHFFRRACFLFSNLMSESVAVIRLSGYPSSIRLALKCEILVLNLFSEEFVRRSLSASPLMKPFLTPKGWQLVPEKCVYWNVSVGLKCVSRSNIDLFANRSPLKTFVSRNVISVYDISAVNLIVWWCFFSCSMNCVTWCLCTFQIENIGSTYLLQTSGLRALRLRICFYHRHKDICKSDCHLGAHGSSICLEVVFSIKLEWVLLSLSALLRCCVGIGGLSL